jgi:hypothetical protein
MSMAGLAALLSFGSDRTSNDTLAAMSRALAPRGSEVARGAIGPARLLMRAALPVVHRFDDAAMVLDGIAERGVLIARFAEQGTTGLLGGVDPYTLILADADGLVLARNGEGAPLYYARTRGAVIVASEPSVLLAAGVPARPDSATIDRYLATGSCDEGPATFFEGIRRVLPGQVVELSRGPQDGWSVLPHPPARPRHGQITARMALLNALGDDRVGVLLGPGLPGAALLGAALSEREQHRALPVYSANFPGLGGAASAYAAALLGPITDGTVRHRATPFFADEIDVDGFLADVGEPVPGLIDYLAWAIAKGSGGEVDRLLSTAGWRGPVGHLPRLSDRVAARYGVALRFPYSEVDTTDEALRAELRALAERTLPPSSTRAASAPHTSGTLEPPLREVLLRLRAELIGALLYPRHGGTDHAGLAVMQTLACAKSADADRLWRRYLLERWLVTVVAPHQKPATTVPAARAARRASGSASGSGSALGSASASAEVMHGGQAWSRRMLRTEPLAVGDRTAEMIAWYVAEFVAAAEKPVRQALRQPWHLLVSAKPVAVAQGLARAVWEIRPGASARGLVRLAGPAMGLPDPWSTQVALEQGGIVRLGLAAICARLGRRAWHDRIAGPLVRSVSPPREHACPPAHLAVVPPPQQPDGVTDEIMVALRKALPDEVFATLAGCAIVGVDEEGPRVLGWSGKGEPSMPLLHRLCQDNPFGQDDERTPLLMALVAPKAAAQTAGRKGGRPAAKRR